MQFPLFRQLLTGLLGAAMLPFVGCRSWVDSYQLTPTAAEPDRSRVPLIINERSPGAPQAMVTPASDGLLLRAARPSYCRVTRVSPTVSERVTRHELSGGGYLGQTVLALGAIGLVGGGAFLVSQPCALPDSQGAPCIEQAESASQMLGTGALVAGGLMAALFVATALGTVDETDEVAGEPQRDSSGWSLCGLQPVAYAPVTLRFADGTVVSGATDADGLARIVVSERPAGRFAELTLGNVRWAAIDLWSAAPFSLATR
jgi:hypothetical protein